MKLQSIYSFYKELEQDNLSMIYQGGMHDELTTMIIALSEQNIKTLEEFKKLKKRISFLIIECFQNIVRHADSNHDSDIFLINPNLFSIRNQEKSYFITSANLVENEKCETLKANIDHINSLDREQLKKYQLEVLSNEEFNERGGAGIGMIAMAIKTGHKLEYDFKKIDDQWSYYYLQLKVLNQEDTENGSFQGNPMKVTQNFQSQMTENNILMIYKGLFSGETILPVIKMIDDNLANKSAGSQNKKRVLMVLIEMLQNVSRYSLINDKLHHGVFMIGKEKDYFISTGNFIKNDKIDELETHINKLNNMNQQELKEIFKATIRKEKSTKNESGLGLIEIARLSGNKMAFIFEPISDGISYFSLKATL